MKLKTRIISKHVKNCRSLTYLKEKMWDSVWCFEEAVFGRKNSPFKPGLHRFAIFKCNIFDCSARAAILLSDVESAMDQK